MKTNRKKSSARSVRLLSVCMLSLFLFGSFGCAQDKPIVFDYASQPEEFVVKLKANQKYTIVRGKDRFPFSLTLKNDLVFDNGTSHLIWNKIDREARMLRAKERVPYLIHSNGKDYLYIYGDRVGDLNFIELSDTNSVRGADNAMLHFYEEPKDPRNLPVRIGINVLGPAAAELRYHVGKLGKPTPNEEVPLLYRSVPERKAGDHERRAGSDFCQRRRSGRERRNTSRRQRVYTAAHQQVAVYGPAVGRRPGVPGKGTVFVQRAPFHHGCD